MSPTNMEATPTARATDIAGPASFSLSLAGERAVVLRRTFAAPRARVFAAFTEAPLMQRWLLGPPGWTMPVCDVDLQPGGAYRIVWRHENGEEMGQRGVFREITPPARLVSTEVFDQAWYAGEALRTLELSESAGRTAMSLTVEYASPEARDQALRSNMEQGVAASFDRLDETLGAPPSPPSPLSGAAGTAGASLLDPPCVVRPAAHSVALLHLTVPRHQIREVMGPGLGELHAAVAAQGIAVTGPWFTHHRRMDPEVFDFEIGVPVAAPMAAAGRVQPGEWPAGAVAQTLYRGPYERLGEAWGQFDAWIESAGHTPAVDLWERYLVQPTAGQDAAACVTELNRPLLATATGG